MSKRKFNFHTIYISERLQECLMPVSHSVLTVVAAPMGYGKTTAVNWYLNKLSKSEKTFIIRISIYSDNVSVFWQSVQKAFSFAGLDFLNNYICPSDTAGASLLADGFLIPFAENYRYLKSVLNSMNAISSDPFISRIISLGSAYEQYCICLSNRSSQPEILKVLNSRETEIACLIVDRLSNREIAEKLFLSEGTIKQYINQIYSKLMINGDTRTKRKQLIELISSIKQ